MRIKTAFISFIIGLLFWIGLNSSVKKEILISGVIISLLISVFFIRKGIFQEIRFTPGALIALVFFLFVFITELFKSTIDVMFRVIAPKVRINPAIVEVKTRLTSKLGRLILANSITLTPGTLTTDIIDDKIYIHWIDASSTDLEGATNKIVEKFEKHLEVIFGR